MLFMKGDPKGKYQFYFCFEFSFLSASAPTAVEIFYIIFILFNRILYSKLLIEIWILLRDCKSLKNEGASKIFVGCISYMDFDLDFMAIFAMLYWKPKIGPGLGVRA